MEAMLIFVRQKRSLKFLTCEGNWAVRFSEARRFPSTWAALDTCTKGNLHQAEIIMRFGAPRYDVVLQVL
jgi:hypothetical protein